MVLSGGWGLGEGKTKEFRKISFFLTKPALSGYKFLLYLSAQDNNSFLLFLKTYLNFVTSTLGKTDGQFRLIIQIVHAEI